MRFPTEELIEVAEDCKVTCATIPEDSAPKTIARIDYEVLIENPYRFTECEFFKVVHFDIRGRTDLQWQSAGFLTKYIVSFAGELSHKL